MILLATSFSTVRRRFWLFLIRYRDCSSSMLLRLMIRAQYARYLRWSLLHSARTALINNNMVDYNPILEWNLKNSTTRITDSPVANGRRSCHILQKRYSDQRSAVWFEKRTYSSNEQFPRIDSKVGDSRIRKGNIGATSEHNDPLDSRCIMKARNTWI